jgi:transcriptional regulator with XRE-family HTH domain
MTFDDWAKKQPHGTLKRLERELGVGYSTLMRLRRGEHIARYDVAKKISDATGGEVSVDEICVGSAPAPVTGTDG